MRAAIYRYASTIAFLTMVCVTVPVGCATQNGSISGHIYQNDGSTVNGEVVVLLDPNPIIIRGDNSHPGITEAKGEYKIKNVPSNQYAVVAAAKDHSLYSEKTTIVNVAERHNIEQNLLLVPGGSIAGHINGLQPTMIESTPLQVHWKREPEGLSWVWFSGGAVVSADGTYLLKDVAPGEIRVDVENGFYHAGPIMVTVKSGEITQQDFSIIK